VVTSCDRLTGLAFQPVGQFDQQRRRRRLGDLIELGAQQPADRIQPFGLIRPAPIGLKGHARESDDPRLNRA